MTDGDTRPQPSRRDSRRKAVAEVVKREQAAEPRPHETWYPPGEYVCLYAMDLAGKHGSPAKAIAECERQLKIIKASPFSEKAAYDMARTLAILRAWERFQ